MGGGGTKASPWCKSGENIISRVEHPPPPIHTLKELIYKPINVVL